MPRFYFAYGSNMCSEQLGRRFEAIYPNKTYKPVAIAKLDNFSWFINNRGYANIMPVATPRKQDDVANQAILPPGPETKDGLRVRLVEAAPSAEVWGLLYWLNSEEIARLDECEGYSAARRGGRTSGRALSRIRSHKQGTCSYNKLTLTVQITKVLGSQSNLRLRKVKALCYVDENDTRLGRMTERYYPRLQAAVIEAKESGVPKNWLKAVVCKEGLYFH
jgi:hypothetical protein